jgi:hypothetical protein
MQEEMDTVKRTVTALLAGAALAVSAVGGPPPTAHADVVADWTMQLVVNTSSWSDLITTNFLGCADLPIQLAVNVGQGVGWSASGQITGVGSTTVLETFAASGSGPAGSPYLSIPGVAMCEHFNGPVAPPDQGYVATVTVSVPTSPVQEQSAATPFTIRRLDSFIVVGANPHELRGGVSALLGRVQVQTHDGFLRPAPVALMTAERLEGATWVTVGQATSTNDGSFVITADRLLATGTYVRFLYPGDQWVAPLVGFPWPLRDAWSPPTPPAPPVFTPPTARVKVKAVSARSRLKVDVNPNRGSKYWTFQVQRKNADGTWKALKTYRTLGSTEKRTVDLRKGTYRVWVNPKFGFQGVMSANEVTLKR